MSPPRVCILTAGRGTRMGERFAWLNKALLSLDDKAVISHIIDACPYGTEFVIGLGHRANQVKSYLELAHADRAFRFVQVDPWQGAGSGPGRSLWCCRHELNEPFVFVPCDLLPSEPIDTERPGSWVGVSRVDSEDSERFCNFEVQEGRVRSVRDKRRCEGPAWRAFTGMMRVDQPEVFWRAIESADPVAGEIQVSSGLTKLAESGDLSAIEHPWTDVGEAPAYRAEIIRRHGYDFSKPGESLYIVNSRVIKLFENEAQANLRVDRGRSGPDVFPSMLDTPPGFLAYEFVDGVTAYSDPSVQVVDRLLAWCESHLWQTIGVGPEELRAMCDGFYRKKTLDRVRQLEQLGGLDDEPSIVMGQPVPGVRELLDGVDWRSLCAGGRAVRFHGDLQFDNVLVRPDGGFTLVDWRQDFAGRSDAGDIDYDLAKMLGGVRIDYSRVKRGVLEYNRSGESATYRLPACTDQERLESIVLGYAERMGRDVSRIRLITALIHLNMSPLHGEPFASALRDLSRVELAAELVPA